MEHILPASVIEFIQKSYIQGVIRAVKGCRFAQEDEHAVTGALGQALFSDDQAVIVNDAVYVWRTTYQRVLGRRPNADDLIADFERVIAD